MAKPISFQSPHRDPLEELRSRVARVPAEHAEAVLAAFEVLQGLHESGVLELMRGLLGSRDKVLGTIVDATETPEMVRIIRNLLSLARSLSAIEPELLDGFVMALPEAISRARAQALNPPGFWQLLNKFRSKDMRRGIVAVNSLLEEWGRDFAAQRGESSNRTRPRE